MHPKLTCPCIVLLAAVSAQAHEFWIEPEAFQTEAGTVLRVGLRLGHRFAGQEVVRDSDLIEQFVIVGMNGAGPVMGRSGARTSFAKIDAPGLHVIGYRSRRSRIELPAEKFERYLQEEGLGFIIPQRAEREESDQPGRELYSRCAKSLICAEGDCAAGHDRILGYPLELIPQHSPYVAQTGGELGLRVLYAGSPLAGAKLVAVNQLEPHKPVTASSNAQGHVALRLAEPGPWMITTIHMVRAPEGLDAEWESFWASLTFELPPLIQATSAATRPEP